MAAPPDASRPHVPYFVSGVHPRDLQVVFEGERHVLLRATASSRPAYRRSFLTYRETYLCWGEDAREAVYGAARRAEREGHPEEAAAWARLLLQSQCGSDAEYALYWRVLESNFVAGNLHDARLIVRGLLRLGCRWEAARRDLRAGFVDASRWLRSVVDVELQIVKDPGTELAALLAAPAGVATREGDD
ncbi:MAG: hypothetical protein R3F05_19350 [Planctomycetota bacterium]